MTVTAVEAPKKRKVPEHILDAIVDTSNGFWLTSTIGGEKYMDRPANDLEIATWRQRDRERKEAADAEKERLAAEQAEPEVIETVPLGSETPPVVEGIVEAGPSDGAVYDSSAEGELGKP